MACLASTSLVARSCTTAGLGSEPHLGPPRDASTDPAPESGEGKAVSTSCRAFGDLSLFEVSNIRIQMHIDNFDSMSWSCRLSPPNTI